MFWRNTITPEPEKPAFPPEPLGEWQGIDDEPLPLEHPADPLEPQVPTPDSYGRSSSEQIANDARPEFEPEWELYDSDNFESEAWSPDEETRLILRRARSKQQSPKQESTQPAASENRTRNGDQQSYTGKGKVATRPDTGHAVSATRPAAWSSSKRVGSDARPDEDREWELFDSDNFRPEAESSGEELMMKARLLQRDPPKLSLKNPGMERNQQSHTSKGKTPIRPFAGPAVTHPQPRTSLAENAGPASPREGVDQPGFIPLQEHLRTLTGHILEVKAALASTQILVDERFSRLREQVLALEVQLAEVRRQREESDAREHSHGSAGVGTQYGASASSNSQPMQAVHADLPVYPATEVQGIPENGPFLPLTQNSTPVAHVATQTYSPPVLRQRTITEYFLPQTRALVPFVERPWAPAQRFIQELSSTASQTGSPQRQQN